MSLNGVTSRPRPPLADGALGAALDYQSGPGRLVAVIHDLNEFTTGAV